MASSVLYETTTFNKSDGYNMEQGRISVPGMPWKSLKEDKIQNLINEWKVHQLCPHPFCHRRGKPIEMVSQLKEHWFYYHMASGHELRFKCDLCASRSFIYARDFQRHSKLHHGLNKEEIHSIVYQIQSDWRSMNNTEEVEPVVQDCYIDLCKISAAEDVKPHCVTRKRHVKQELVECESEEDIFNDQSLDNNYDVMSDTECEDQQDTTTLGVCNVIGEIVPAIDETTDSGMNANASGDSNEENEQNDSEGINTLKLRLASVEEELRRANTIIRNLKSKNKMLQNENRNLQKDLVPKKKRMCVTYMDESKIDFLKNILHDLTDQSYAISAGVNGVVM